MLRRTSAASLLVLCALACASKNNVSSGAPDAAVCPAGTSFNVSSGQCVAGAVDGGLADARGLPDAAAPDAVIPPDAAALPDAASPDAVPLDAAPPDAATPDAAPVLSPPDTMITTAPPPVADSLTAVFTFVSLPPGASFECSLDGALPFTTCASPLETDGLAAGQHTFAVRAVAAGGTDATPATYDWRVDQSGLVVTIALTAGLACATTGFTFAASAPGVSYACALDGAAFVPCAGNASYADLADGSAHIFQVHAIAADGAVGPDATQAFVVDASAPAVVISSPVAGSTTGPMPTLAFVTEAGATVSCALDGQPLATCAGLPTLAGGAHTLVVTAADACGNRGSAAATWQVDATGPTVTILAPVDGATAPGSGTIVFTTQGDATGVTCVLDGHAVACDLSGFVQYSLPDGPHRFTATATDAAGNPGAASVGFIADGSPPIVTRLDVTPADGGQVGVAFTLADASPVVLVHCVVDGDDEVCAHQASGAITLVEQSPGVHDLQVYGVDLWGNTGVNAPPRAVAAARAEAGFVVTLDPGRAVLIGHDYHQLDEEGALAQIIAAAVVSSPAAAFSRPLRVLGFRAPGLDPTACDNVLASISARLGGSGTCAAPAFPWYSEFHEATKLDAALVDHDVLLIFDQRDAEAASDLGVAWHEALRDFLDRGGVVIVLDGAGDGDDAIFARSGDRDGPLLELDDAVSDADLDSASVYQADDPIAIAASASYTPPDGTVAWQSSDPYAVNVYTADILVGAPPLSAVLEKPFPDPVVVTLYDNQGHIDPTGQVVFIDARDAQFLVHADLGGHAVHNLHGGGSVTGAQSIAGGPQLTTFLGAERLDVLKSNALQALPGPPTFGAITVDTPTGGTPPPDLDSSRPIVLDVGTSAGAVPNLQTGFDDDAPQFRITALDDDGLVDGLAVARDSQNHSVAYTTFTGVALVDEAAEVALPDWPWTTPSFFGVTIDEAPAEPPLEPINGMVATNSVTEVNLSVSLYAGHRGLDYLEGTDGYSAGVNVSDGVTFPFPFPPFVTKPHFMPAGFADSTMAELTLFYLQSQAVGHDGEVVQESQTYRQRLPRLGAADFTARVEDMLPIVGRIAIDGSDPSRPMLSVVSPAPLVLSGGQVVVEYSSTDGVGHVWTLVFPGGETIAPPAFNDAMKTALAAYLTPSAFESIAIQGRFEQASGESYADYRAAFPQALSGPSALPNTPLSYDKVVIYFDSLVSTP